MARLNAGIQNTTTLTEFRLLSYWRPVSQAQTLRRRVQADPRWIPGTFAGMTENDMGFSERCALLFALLA